jgi:hypothetical protein
MTRMPLLVPNPEAPRAARAARAAAAATPIIAAICVALALAGCGTSAPRPILAGELAEAQTFPYYRTYWVGPRFDGQPLSAADGLRSYISSVGDSVYYGDCVQGKSIIGGGSCELPLQVTTVIYGLHSNKALGTQRNILVRGVPATVYDEGRAIEIYTGRVAIDIFSDSFAHALRASEELYPLNAPGSSATALPPPVYCPGLYGAVSASIARVMASLPHHACQRAAAEEAYIEAVTG